MLLYSFAINRLGSHTVTLQMAFVPVISALAAVPLLNEPLSLLTLGGLIAVTAGAVLGARVANKAGAEGNPSILFVKHDTSCRKLG
jgi:drug/metabolite transporter (DMT)-like permease